MPLDNWWPSCCVLQTRLHSPFPLLLENLLHTIAQQPQSITSRNMSGSFLKSISSHLFDCLQGMYWDREKWRELKTDVKKVAPALANYTSYLQKSCKKTLLNQTHTSPVQQLSDSLTFQFLPLCSANTSSSLTSELCERLNECSAYEYLQVEQYCPTQSMMKYKLMKAMKSNGIPFPTDLVTYTHGNKFENLNFLWKIQGYVWGVSIFW